MRRFARHFPGSPGRRCQAAEKAVRAGKAARVYLAENADPALTQPLAELCGEYQIQITWVADMADLGRACGIEVGAAAAAVLKILPENSVE